MSELALAAVMVLAAPLHVEPQVSEAPAGARTTFSFLVEHGCDASPTVQVSIQVPDGAFDVVPVAPEGWTGVVEPDTATPVVTFTGGPLPADVEGTFGVELVTPNRPGEDAFFPTVQTCEAGEIGWVDTADGAEEPAPRIRLTENPNPILQTTTTAPATPATTTSSTAAATTTVTTIEQPTTRDEDDPPWLPIGAVVVAATAVGYAAVRRRRAA